MASGGRLPTPRSTRSPAANNIRPAAGVAPWTDNISHGELIRASNDQRLTVDPGDLRFLFQGMLEKDKSGKGYGQFGWRLGMLKPAGKGTKER